MGRWIKFVQHRPWLVIAVVFAITVGLASFLPRMEFDASIENMMPQDDPVLAELQDAVADFGSQDLFFIAIESDDVFRPATLQKIADLTAALEEVPAVKGVENPFNVQMVESSFFGIEIAPMAAEVPQTADEIEAFKARILASPYGGRLITADGRGAALMLDVEWDLEGNNREKVINEISSVVEGYIGPEEIHMVGDAYILHYTEQAMKRDLRNLVPIVVLVIATTLYFTFRSFLGVLVPLLTVGAALTWTVGLMIWYGIPVSMISMAMPVILVTLGIASGIHILNKYLETLGQGMSKESALQETFATITSPVLMAAFTTAAGFASLITAFVQPIKEFGVITAVGVMIAMTLSLSLIPAMLVLWKKPEVKQEKREAGVLNRFLKTLTQWTISRPAYITAIAVVIVLVFGFGATRITLESNIVNYFGANSPVKKGTMVIEEIFGGSMQISVVVDTGVEDGFKDPAMLEELIVIQDYLNSWDSINHATSLADVVRELNQALWEGDPEFYAVPETREGVAQQLLLFSMQGGSGLDSLVSYDYSRALVTAQMKTLDAEMLGETIAAVESYLAELYRDRSDISVKLVGTPKVMMRLMNRYVQTQISSLASSSVAVGLIVAALMKSVLLGILTLVPLFFTVLINFGLMGYAGLPLDAVTSIIAGVVIGLGVDYAIHYISRYRLERANGHQMEQALLNTGVSAGRGIFFNALALVIGFMVLVFSHFRAIAVFGFLISVTMVVSSFAALVVIPLLLQYFDRKKVQVERSM
ncbi:MAG: RND family transporter [Firmicutes bacterium]|nr:MMPL family transporter [Bacillota bacterium]NLO66403.1 RND family transporter [Bacillota bacterium]